MAFHREPTKEEIDRLTAYNDYMYKIINDEASAGNDNTLSVTVYSGIRAIVGRCQSQDPHRLLDFDLHTFWHSVIQAAKGYELTNPKQLEMIHELLAARKMGVIIRTYTDETTGATETDFAQNSKGQMIWRDLPFMAEDMLDVWRNTSLQIKASERNNLSGFMARLLAVGACDELVGCAVWLFRDTLETPRRLSDDDAGDDVPVSGLISALAAWLTYARHKIQTLARQSYTGNQDDAEAVFAPGPLAQSAGIEGGLTLARWKFWVVSLEAMSQVSHAFVAEEAKYCLKVMSGEDGYQPIETWAI